MTAAATDKLAGLLQERARGGGGAVALTVTLLEWLGAGCPDTTQGLGVGAPAFAW